MNSTTDNGPLVHIKNLQVDLDEFTLSVPEFQANRGQLTVVTGPNGSGKSVFLQVLAGLYHRYSGTIEWAMPVGRKMTIGYMDNQGCFIEDLSVGEILALCAGATIGWETKTCQSLVKTLDLDPAKLVRTLSSGNRAKLSLVVAVAQRPTLLVFDEPFAFLDERCRTELAAIIDLHKQEGGCAIMASHDFDAIAATVDSVISFDVGIGTFPADPAKVRSSGRVENQS